MSAAKLKLVRPYGLGFGGHARKCECTDCVRRKLAVYSERVAKMSSPLLPDEPGAYVPVRAHYRRQSNYLKKQPKLKQAVTFYISQLLKRKR